MIGEEINCEAGTVLLQEGKEADWLYLLLSGGVDINFKSEDVHYPNGVKVFHVGEVNPGDLFGYSSMVAPYKYLASATASQASRIIRFDARALRTLGDLDCGLGLAVMQQIAKTAVERLVYTWVQLVAARE
jgi:CRP-like cAMP-binding protein